MIDYMQKGGPLMWLLLLLSIISTTVFLERLIFYHRSTLRVGEFLRGLANLISRRNFAEALHESAGTSGPVARVIHAALLRYNAPRAELKDIVQEAGQLEMPRLERRLTILLSIAYIAPLVGLLGTVTGLIEALVTISSQAGYATSAEISVGLYKSLLTTAAGLVVAIPTTLAYTFLSSRVNVLMHDMERGGIEIVNLITDASADKSGIIDFGAGRPAAIIAEQAPRAQ